jgi:hypothetical protein
MITIEPYKAENLASITKFVEAMEDQHGQL